MSLIRAQEAADRLNIRYSTLRKWVMNGKIPFVKLHGAVRFDEDELDAFVEANTHRPAPLAGALR